MKYLKLIIPFLDNIFIVYGVISFIIASYFVNAVLGAYVLGTAFLVAAYFAGVAMRKPKIQGVFVRMQRK